MLCTDSTAINCRYLLLLCSFSLLTTSSCSRVSQPNSFEHIQHQLAVNYPSASLPSSNQEKTETLHLLLKDPLTPQTAVQILLLNSPRIEAQMARSEVADAEFLKAGIISNPRFSFTLLKPENSNLWLWDFGISQSVTELATRNYRIKKADTEVRAIQLDINKSLQSTINELQHAFFTALADKQKLRTQEVLLDVANAKKELAESLFRAGNISELDYLQHVINVAQQEKMVGLQKMNATNTQAELNYQLGFTTQTIALSDNIPALPLENYDKNDLINEALDNQIDIKILKLQRNTLDSQVELIKKEYGVAGSSLGIAAKREENNVTSVGPTVDYVAPLFDNGDTKISSLKFKIKLIDAEIRDKKTSLARDIIQNVEKMKTAAAYLLQIDKSLEDAQRRVELAQREVNFMLSNAFELIEIKSQRVQLELEKTNALLDYWNARSELEFTLGHALPIQELKKNNEPPAEHHHHDMKNMGGHSHD